MKSNGMLKKQCFLWVVAVACVLLLAGYPKAETKNKAATKKANTQTTAAPEKKKKVANIKKNFTNPKTKETMAKVMEVNADNFYMVIAEDIFYVAKFKINGETQQTVLTDASGNEIDMDAFEKRDLVKVTSIELDPSKFEYVALAIEKLPPRKE